MNNPNPADMTAHQLQTWTILHIVPRLAKTDQSTPSAPEPHRGVDLMGRS